MKNLKKKAFRYFSSKKLAFSGVTHMLIATLLFQVIWMIPFFAKYIEVVKGRGVVTICLFWMVLIGSSIMPDLDNNVSSAKYQLGFVGKAMSMFMIMISSAIYTVFKTKKDHCKSQHRMFWHAPLIYIAMFALSFFLHPEDGDTLFKMIKDKSLFELNISSIALIGLFLFLSFCGIYLFVNFLFYHIGKLLKSESVNMVKVIFTVACFILLIFFADINCLKLMSYAVCLGNIFHIVGDLFSLGSVPLFFPLPIKGQIWFKPKHPLQLETGGAANRVLNFLLVIVIAGMFFLMYQAKN